MILTIVKPDNLTIVDRKPQMFNLLDFDVPGNLHALQWQNETGHIEYSNQSNEDISQLPEWVEPLIEEHKRITEIKEAEREKSERQAVHLSNGSARQNRIEEQRQRQQQYINNLVMEKLA